MSETVSPSLAVPEPPGVLVDVGGHRLHLYCTGEGDPTVLLDAGSGDWSLKLRPLQDELAATTRVCTYDRAGSGWSEPGPAPRTGERIVDELEALLEAAAEPGPYVLAGHSFGGLTMLLWFGMAPDSREASFEEAISEALLVDTANNARTEGAPQQAVVNGWTAKDLLTVIAREGAQPSDERPAALLVLVVVGIAGMIAMSPRTERVVEPEASAAVQDAHASV